MIVKKESLQNSSSLYWKETKYRSLFTKTAAGIRVSATNLANEGTLSATTSSLLVDDNVKNMSFEIYEVATES
jgi:hypothetical protein